jgi:acyl-CoA hydrolase
METDRSGVTAATARRPDNCWFEKTAEAPVEVRPLKPCLDRENAMEPGNAQLSMTVLMTPDMANFSGNVHGGTLLKYLDEVAYACASRYAGRYVVTLSVDQVIFREPIHVGELVTFLASVNYTGNTSMEVGIKVVTENIRERSVRHTNSCFFTMVAVDDQRKPAPCRHCNQKTAKTSAVTCRRSNVVRFVRNWKSVIRKSRATPEVQQSFKKRSRDLQRIAAVATDHDRKSL